MMIAAKKRGRKASHFIAQDGTQIKGLGYDKRSDRWRVIESNRFFRAPNEAVAIAKFHELTGQSETKAEQSEQNRRLAPMSRGQMRDWARSYILDTPMLAAKELGIEWLAYGPQLKKPQPLPSFKSLETVWKENCRASAEQRRKVLHAWKDFVSTTKVAGLAEITPEVVIQYRDAVYGRDLSGKSQQNLFSRIRRIVSFSRDRAIAIEAMNKTLQYLAILKPSETTVSIDPKPIEQADFTKLLNAATGDDKAMLLLQMNAALYLQEAVNVRWDDIKANGCFITNRHKTGRCIRVAVLWAETIEALKQVKHKGEFVFYSYAGVPLGIKGAEKRFRRLRDDAEVPHVTSSMLRDGAATAIAEMNVNEQLLNLSLGHRSGIKDHYVLRNPKMVKPASEAIRMKYLGK